MSSPTRLIAFVATALSLGLAPARADFHHHIGLQLYSLRAQFITSPLKALDLTKSYGVTEVEGGGSTQLTPSQFRSELDARGLHCVSAHVQYGDMQKDLPAVIKTVQTLGAKFAVCPWVPHQDPYDAATNGAAAANFEKWGAAFRAVGIRFGYHPHGYEFIPGSKSGQTLFDDLAAATTPENVCFELDVFWAYVAGQDPVALLDRYGSRFVALHLKDLRKGVPRLPGTSHVPAEDNVAVGDGQIDWVTVIRAAEKHGVTHYFIEDETPVPLEAIPASLEYLRALTL